MGETLTSKLGRETGQAKYQIFVRIEIAPLTSDPKIVKLWTDLALIMNEC